MSVKEPKVEAKTGASLAFTLLAETPNDTYKLQDHPHLAESCSGTKQRGRTANNNLESLSRCRNTN